MKITAYSTETCVWCHKLKDFLKEHQIEFEEFDVGKDHEKAKEMVEKSGQMGVPVTEIDGEIVIGFDEPRLKRLLKIKD